MRVESLGTLDDGRRTYRSYQKNVSLSQRDVFFLSPLMASLKFTLCTVLTTQNSTQTDVITHKRSRLHLSRIHFRWNDWFVVKKNDRSAGLSSNNYQGHLQTPQSVYVLRCTVSNLWKHRIVASAVSRFVSHTAVSSSCTRWVSTEQRRISGVKGQVVD